MLFVLLTIGLVELSAQIPSMETEWLQQEVKTINSLDLDDFSDLEFLKKELKDVRIIQLGESSHGIGDYYRMKGRLVRFLHQELGFNVLAIEGGFGDINVAYSNINASSAQELMDRSVFSNFNCEEMLETFSYVKEQSKHRPLHLAGFDCQESAVYFKPFMVQLLVELDTTMSQEFESKYHTTFDLYGMIRDSVQLMGAIALNKALLEEVENFINSNSITLEKSHSKALLKVIRRTIHTKISYWELSFAEIQQFKGYALRDRLMAENIKWLADSLYPDQKIIIWAHNAHIHKGEALYPGPDGQSFNMMGGHLEDYFGQQNYVLGLYSYEGETYRHFKQDTIAFVNDDPESLEVRFDKLEADINWLSFQAWEFGKANHWLKEPIKVFELENGGWITWPNLMQRYDAVLVIRKVRPPRY